MVSPSGKDKLLRHCRLFVGGFDLSGDSRNFSSADATFDEVEMTGWSELVKNFQAGWLTAGLRGYEVLLNDAAGRGFAVLKDADNAVHLSLCFGGGGEPAAPDPCYILPAVQMNDAAGFNGGAAVLSGIDFLPMAGQMTNFYKPHGVVLQGAVSLTATQAASSAISHDGVAASASGWAAIIHVLATASGNFAFKLRHSTDDSNWSDLGTFTTTGGAVGSELLTGTGTVNQYVALDATRTAGSVTVVCTFVRN